MQKNKPVYLFIILIALGLGFLFQSCARVDLDNGNTSNNTSHTIARLYVGLSSDTDKEGIETSAIENIMRKHFDGATLQEATGFYKGRREKSLIITIINCCSWEQPQDQFLKRIKLLASELRHELDQESVLVEQTYSGETRIFEIME